MARLSREATGERKRIPQAGRRGLRGGGEGRIRLERTRDEAADRRIGSGAPGSSGERGLQGLVHGVAYVSRRTRRGSRGRE